MRIVAKFLSVSKLRLIDFPLLCVQPENRCFTLGHGETFDIRFPDKVSLKMPYVIAGGLKEAVELLLQRKAS